MQVNLTKQEVIEIANIVEHIDTLIELNKETLQKLMINNPDQDLKLLQVRLCTTKTAIRASEQELSKFLRNVFKETGAIINSLG